MRFSPFTFEFVTSLSNRPTFVLLHKPLFFIAHDSIMQSAQYSIARPSICPSHMVDQSKTIEIRVMHFYMQLSPHIRPIPLDFAI